MVDTTDTPNDILAKLILRELETQSIVPVKNIGEIKLKLAKGTATAADWRLWAELSLDEQARATPDHSEGPGDDDAD
jgi:hypothetical protein